jgi:hypothetical protein
VISSSQGLYLYTNTKKRTHTNTKHPCPEWDSKTEYALDCSATVTGICFSLVELICPSSNGSTVSVLAFCSCVSLWLVSDFLMQLLRPSLNSLLYSFNFL